MKMSIIRSAMLVALAGVALATPSMARLALAQTAKVDMRLLLAELKKRTSKSDAMTTAIWMPEEFFRGFIEGADMAQEEVEEFLTTLRPYTFVFVVDGTVGPFRFTYVPEAKLRESTWLVDEHGRTYSPLSEDEVDPDTRNRTALIESMMANSFGEFGEHARMLIFPARDGQGHRIAEAMKEGSFSIRVGQEEFKWRLPLGSLLPPKMCPVDGETLSGAWNFCPWHGVELVKADTRTTEAQIDPRDDSGVGVEGGVPPLIDLAQVFNELVVDEPPHRFFSPPLVYPLEMQQAGIEGLVVLQAVVDTTGRIERGSIEVVQSTNAAFDGAARRMLERSLFRPGRVRGRPVRVLIQLPFEFTLIGGDLGPEHPSVALALLPIEGRLLVPDAELSGTLSEADTVYNGLYVQAWGLQLHVGQQVTVDMISEDFDAFLWLTGQGLDEPLLDDDGGGACHARITFTASQDGLYRVIASSVMAGESGEFVMRLSGEPGPVSEGRCLSPGTGGAGLAGPTLLGGHKWRS